jgi:hypothetical protein
MPNLYLPSGYVGPTGTAAGITNDLTTVCLSCICPSHNKHSGLEIRNSSRGLYGRHWCDGVGKESVVDQLPRGSPTFTACAVNENVHFQVEFERLACTTHVTHNA